MPDTKITEAILLVGGLGTRLKSVIADKPKPLADINGKPFLEHLLDHLIENDIQRVVLAVGYKHEMIKEHFKNGYKNLEIDFAIEKQPLGTGGAIVNALEKVKADQVLILNGDVFCTFKLSEIVSDAKMQITAISVDDVSRYGSLEIDGDKLISFNEKGKTGDGLINAGIYLAKRSAFSNYSVGDKFSFELDFVPNYLKSDSIKVKIIKKRIFIDIGTPEDYSKAQKLLS